MSYKIVATVTGRKRKYEYTREFWSESNPTQSELRFIKKRLRQEVSGHKHFRGRPEDFDVWVEVEPTQKKDGLIDLSHMIAIDQGKLAESIARSIGEVSTWKHLG